MSPRISVCVPTYKSADTIKDTIRDVLNQTYQNFEIIVSDDNSKDNTEEIVKGFNDKRIRFFQNEGEQLGCGGNERKCMNLAEGEIIFMLPGKDRISKRTLLLYHNAFKNPEVGAVTRLYYWFGKNVNQAVRAKKQHYQDDLKVILADDLDKIIAVFETVDNSGGIAFRKDFLKIPFNDTPFVEFTYPFAEILKFHPVVLINKYLMACPAFKHSHSQDSYVYKESPMKNWIDMFETVYLEYPELRKGLIKKFVAVNYVGLIQTRNYGTYGQYLREIWYLIKYRWSNLFNIRFWFFVLVTILIPRFFLKCLVRKFKERRNLNVSLAGSTRI